MANIIIRDREFRIGKTRSEQAENLRREGWGTGGLSDEQIDKCKHLEKKGTLFPSQAEIDQVK